MRTATATKFGAAALTARPYVKRAISDEELRSSVKAAVAAARTVYDDLIGDRSVAHVATRVASDEDIQDNLRTAIKELRNAADRLQGKGEEAHRRRGRVLLIFGIVLGVLFNPVTGPATRKWISGKVSGGDQYGTGQTNGFPG